MTSLHRSELGLIELPALPRIDHALTDALRGKLAGKAKPPGSLGRLEELAATIGLIKGTLAPRLDRVSLLIFAADHGLVEEGVSSYPAAVTAAMVRTFLAGRASANAIAAAVGAEVIVVDAGVASDLPPHPRLLDRKVAHGTRNAAREPALTPAEVAEALRRGVRLGAEAIDGGADAIALGEMGIGNTACASLLMHRLLPAPLALCIGAGAGHASDGLARKRAALERAAARSDATDPFGVLCQFGGLEVVMMAGALLGAASRRGVVVVDGFIASAAALAAIRLCPGAQEFCVFAHRSAERGHAALLQQLDADPLLELGMRLGEGTGALLAVPMLRAAARLLTDVADLEDVLSGAI